MPESVTIAINVDLVKAAEDVVSAVGAVIADADRSVVVEVDNQLPFRLTFDSSDHDHGGFGSVLPRGGIEPMSADVFSSRSSGVFTGTEGHIYYRFNDSKFFIHWDNPELGSNGADAHVEPGGDPRFQVLAIVGNGNSSHTRFIIADSTVPGAWQPGWSACAKCQGMHFSGFVAKGVCPAGGEHAQTNSFQYEMLFNSRQSNQVQTGWRSCPKCQGMHFGDISGVCPAGGQHASDGSFEYAMLFGIDPTDRMQLDWKSCRKCQGLFFGPFKGRCPAGDQHDDAGSFAYASHFV